MKYRVVQKGILFKIQRKDTIGWSDYKLSPWLWFSSEAQAIGALFEVLGVTNQAEIVRKEINILSVN